MQTDRDDGRNEAGRSQGEPRSGRNDGESKPTNTAPDAVMDPNEKTGGKPGVPAGSQGGETDPGGS